MKNIFRTLALSLTLCSSFVATKAIAMEKSNKIENIKLENCQRFLWGSWESKTFHALKYGKPIDQENFDQIKDKISKTFNVEKNSISTMSSQQLQTFAKNNHGMDVQDSQGQKVAAERAAQDTIFAIFLSHSVRGKELLGLAKFVDGENENQLCSYIGEGLKTFPSIGLGEKTLRGVFFSRNMQHLFKQEPTLKSLGVKLVEVINNQLGNNSFSTFLDENKPRLKNIENSIKKEYQGGENNNQLVLKITENTEEQTIIVPQNDQKIEDQNDPQLQIALLESKVEDLEKQNKQLEDQIIDIASIQNDLELSSQLIKLALKLIQKQKEKK